MNRVVLMGRLTKDPDIRESNGTLIARYTLAVDRRRKTQDGQTADFISCVSFSKDGDKGGGAVFLKNYCSKGTKLVIGGRIQTGSYTNKDGQKVYTTDVVTDDIEFAESKNSAPEKQEQANNGTAMGSQDGGFMNVPDNIDEELPFN